MLCFCAKEGLKYQSEHQVIIPENQFVIRDHQYSANSFERYFHKISFVKINLLKYWTIGYLLGGAVYAQVFVFYAKINDRYISALNCLCNTTWHLSIMCEITMMKSRNYITIFFQCERLLVIKYLSYSFLNWDKIRLKLFC